VNDGAAASLEVRELDPATAPRWDAFVEATPEATFFHLSGWRRVIEESFGHRTHYLYAEAGGRIRGVLPLVHLRSRLFGNALISNAFCVYGGPVAGDDAARARLDDRALALARSLGVEYLEYRARRRLHADWACNDSLYATFRKAIDPDPQVNLLAIPRKQRAVVRKAIEAGLESEIDPDPGRAWRIYAESVHRLGTPVFGRAYFANLARTFGAACEALTVVYQGRPLSSVVSFYFRDEVLPYYGDGTADARRLGANDFMYWELMRRAAERGCRVFDFGRSKRGTGAFDFKRFWGFEPEPLYYEYRLCRGTRPPGINPLNPKYRLFIAAWKRLPLPLANALGPLIARNLG
jgi:FemAB-related protein (PEP-CTERM system-associated)